MLIKRKALLIIVFLICSSFLSKIGESQFGCFGAQCCDPVHFGKKIWENTGIGTCPSFMAPCYTECRNECGGCEDDGDCPSRCLDDTREYNGNCQSDCRCSYSTENCNDRESCVAFGNGCRETDYICSGGSCILDGYRDEHQDEACGSFGCSADKCSVTAWLRDWKCSGDQCTGSLIPCGWDCDSGDVCSGGSCGSGNCGTQNCPSDYCDGMTWYNYPSSCTKECDGAGICQSCLPCSSSSTTCTASGCCNPTCSDSGGCGTTSDDSECTADGWVCNGDIREYRDRFCDSSCSCDYTVTSSTDCTSRTGCGQCGCPSDQKPNSCFCGGSSCQNSGCTPCITSCSGYSTQSSCNGASGCTWCTGDDTCYDSSDVDCQPPSCSGDDRCTNSCSWSDCGTDPCPADYCSGTTYRDYPSRCSQDCSGGSCDSCSCSYTSRDCTLSNNWDGDGVICNCDCGGYDVQETTANGNCGDGLDNDCDGNPDGADSGCGIPCVPDGCNSNCPAGCDVSQDPDCGCQDGNGCCAPGCNNLNDNDCPLDICSLTTSSVTPNCAGGSSTNCEIGETISIDSEFTGTCDIDANTYFRIKVRSLDGTCIVNLDKQNPSLSTSSTLDTVDLIAVLDGKVTFDRDIEDGCTDSPLALVDDPESCFRHSTTGKIVCAWDQGFEPVGEEDVVRSYVEWDISSIPDASSVSNVDFIYHGSWGWGAARNIYINRMDTRSVDHPLLSSLFNDMRTGPQYASHYPLTLPNTLVDLDNDARNDMNNALGTRDWFAIGLHLSAEGASGMQLVVDIHDEGFASANPKPTLRVEYYSPMIDDTWIISSISGNCEGKTVYAYEAELWDGQPNIGPLISRITDSNPSDSSPVDGSFVFADLGPQPGLWCDGFDDGTTDAWDDIGDTPTVQSAVKYTGTYALECDRGDAVRKNVAESQSRYARFHVMFDSLFGNEGDLLKLGEFIATEGETAFYGIQKISGTWRWWFRYRDSGAFVTDYSSFAVTTGVWHCIQIEHIRGSSGNGLARMNIDGTATLGDGTISNSARGNTIATRFGWYATSYEGSTKVYIDEVCVDESSINCAVGCVADGCNENCPVGCDVSQDPDCDCQDDDLCCGIGCDFTNDNDCGEVLTVDTKIDVLGTVINDVDITVDSNTKTTAGDGTTSFTLTQGPHSITAEDSFGTRPFSHFWDHDANVDCNENDPFDTSDNPYSFNMNTCDRTITAWYKVFTRIENSTGNPNSIDYDGYTISGYLLREDDNALHYAVNVNLEYYDGSWNPIITTAVSTVDGYFAGPWLSTPEATAIRAAFVPSDWFYVASSGQKDIEYFDYVGASQVNFSGKLEYKDNTPVEFAKITVTITYQQKEYIGKSASDINGDFFIKIDIPSYLIGADYLVNFYVRNNIEAVYECWYDHITEQCTP